ncbi:MAG: choice-of-anchor L domain-containing protein [Bacteroidota bacterium]
MKNIFTLALLFFAVSLFAQPVNDDCDGIIDLGVAPICDSTVYTNIDATATDIGNDNIPTNCSQGGDWTFTGRDVWFQFTSSDTILDYSFTVNGVGTDPLNNPQIAIYRGDICGFDEMALFACARAEDGETTIELQLDGLDFDTPYFIRINDWSPSASPNSGTFNLCIKEQDPINTIDQEGSTACTGELYDSGGPDENYSPDENNTFSICPPTPNNGCVTFNLQYFNIGDAGDQLNFYDGPDNNSPQIVSIDGFDFNGDNNGGVCYTVQASSGCLTVELISDGLLEFEGFAATWECSIMPCEPLQPITINDNIDDQDMIDNITTPQTLVTIATIICEQGAYGTFLAGDDTDLGLGQGLLLTTGSANQVAGPAPGASISNGLGTPGDSDLDYLSDLLGNGSLSNDACIVELDVFVATNELNFEYIFGSEEYPEFVGGQFNDIFAFLISGDGITGDPNIDNQLNIATLPGTNTPVEINSVNNSINWQYYRNNEDGQSVAYDGLTSDFLGVKKSLTATASVTPCQTYHLKLAVADRGDGILDSGVFIGELKGGTPNTALNSSLGLEFLVEDCTGSEDEVTITLNNPQEDDQTYVVNVGGSATRDVDYILNMPDTITIPSGETELSFSIVPISDGIFEGPETITIQLTNDFGCGVVELAVLNINLLDEPIVEINSGVDTVLVCQDSCASLSAFGGATYFWTPPGLFDDDTSPMPIACPDSSQWITVSGSIGALPGCSDVDSVFLQIIDPTMDVVTMDETNICEGDSVQLSAVNNVNDLNLTWSPTAGLDDPNSPTPLAIPSVTTTYTATVDVFGCLATDQITINVDPFDFPEVTDDMIICQGSVVQLADALPGSTTQFEWSPADFLDDANIAGATATLNTTGTIKYVLTATSESGFCSQQDSVEFNVLPAEVSIQEGDTAFLCLGDSIRLNAFTSTGGAGLNWFPDDSISNTTNTEVTVFPTVSTWYFASLDVGGCSVLDSIFVRVDSLPDLSISLDPEKDPYCSGEFVTLSSPIFDPDDYPDIEHLWFPFAGQETDSTFLNLVVSTFDTITYFRATTNNACSDTTEVTLNVLPPIVLEITNDTTVCEGEMVQLNVSSDDPDATFTWMPDAGLSCSDCPNPIATLTDTIDYTVTGEVFGCPAFEDVVINVENEPVLELAPDPTICLGESVMLNSLIDPNATYEWTSNDPNFGTVTDPTPMVSPDSSYTYFVTMSKEACNSIQGEVNVNVIINILQIQVIQRFVLEIPSSWM